MPRRRSSAASRLAADSAALAVAAPAVVAHRLARLAAAGVNPSARDRREFHRMGAEKIAAFNESWAAMAARTVQVQVETGAALARAFWFPFASGWPSPAHAPNAMMRDAIAILGQGLAPVHRRAVANAKRLSRSPRKR